MPDITSRSDSVNVEQIMEQIRARIREKRGVEDSNTQVREAAATRLAALLPDGARSTAGARSSAPVPVPQDLPSYVFEEDTLFDSTRGLLRFIRRLLRPILKLFFNPNPLIQALNIQSRLNQSALEREQAREQPRLEFEEMQYAVIKRLVDESTRAGVEIKQLRMQIESLMTRIDFSERRVRSIESLATYRPATEPRPEPRSEPRTEPPPRPAPPERDARPREAPPPSRDFGGSQPSAAAGDEPPAPPQHGDGQGQRGLPQQGDGQGQRSRRRRRRRGRRGGGSGQPGMTGGPAPQPGAPSGDAISSSSGAPDASDAPPDAAFDAGGDDNEFDNDALSQPDPEDSDADRDQ